LTKVEEKEKGIKMPKSYSLKVMEARKHRGLTNQGEEEETH